MMSMSAICIQCADESYTHGAYHDNGKIYKVYLAGPMLGRPGNNVRDFRIAAMYCRGFRFWDTMNPHEFKWQNKAPEELDGPTTRAWYLHRDLVVMAQCDAIVLLDGWEESRGAQIELTLARAANMGVYEFEDDPKNDEYHIWRSNAMPSLAVVSRHLYEVTNNEAWAVGETGIGTVLDALAPN
jgi:nucleoside 2-deoxyribosyltransferase